jgi:hypothetical protein
MLTLVVITYLGCEEPHVFWYKDIAPQVHGRIIVLFGTGSNRFLLNFGTFLPYYTESLSKRQLLQLGAYGIREMLRFPSFTLTLDRL